MPTPGSSTVATVSTAHAGDIHLGMSKVLTEAPTQSSPLYYERATPKHHSPTPSPEAGPKASPLPPEQHSYSPHPQAEPRAFHRYAEWPGEVANDSGKRKLPSPEGDVRQPPQPQPGRELEEDLRALRHASPPAGGRGMGTSPRPLQKAESAVFEDRPERRGPLRETQSSHELYEVECGPRTKLASSGRSLGGHVPEHDPACSLHPQRPSVLFMLSSYMFADLFSQTAADCSEVHHRELKIFH